MAEGSADACPNPWAQAMPELFQEDLEFEVLDDGRWNLYMLRRELNARLDRAALGGRYVLKDVAGVRDGVLRDDYAPVEQLAADP